MNIGAGDLLHLVSSFGAVAMLWAALQSRLARLEAEVSHTTAAVERLTNKVERAQIALAEHEIKLGKEC